MISLLKILLEEIDPSEAYNDRDAIQTLLDGKRDLAFFTAIGMSRLTPKDLTKMIKDHNSQKEKEGKEQEKIKILKVIGNEYKAFITYRNSEEGLRKAKELKAIAEKYGGFLAWYAEYQDTMKIGKLLGYRMDAVKDFADRMRIKKIDRGYPDD
jgi:hypothetical protein